MAVSVHLVGSIGLDTVEEVFTTVGRMLGPYLRRVPDGEPGGRRMWSQWQVPVLRANPCLQQVRRDGGALAGPLELASGARMDDVHFGELGYAREARTSYEDFLEARGRGDLPTDVRFQVALPTPWAVIMGGGRFVPGLDEAILPAYEAAMVAEVDRICDRIPQHDLAIQWDIAVEMLLLDGQFRDPFPNMEQTFGEAFARLAAAVPEEVELGFHLCYGDLDGKHLREPRDTAKLVEMAHLIGESLRRPIAYIHMPVPVGRHDDGYFAPLQALRLPPATQLYLGVVHAADGLAGTLQRIEVARKYAPPFGLASECGISRGRTRDVAIEFLRVYAAAAERS